MKRVAWEPNEPCGQAPTTISKMLNEASHPKIALREPGASLPMRKNKAACAVHTVPKFDSISPIGKSKQTVSDWENCLSVERWLGDVARCVRALLPGQGPAGASP
jgi:hypothetical protein